MRWCGVPQEEEESRKVNRKIDKEIELERKMRKKEVKILLLGTRPAPVFSSHFLLFLLIPFFFLHPTSFIHVFFQ